MGSNAIEAVCKIVSLLLSDGLAFHRFYFIYNYCFPLIGFIERSTSVIHCDASLYNIVDV